MTLIPVPRVGVIVVAAGSGTRLGAGAPKAFVGIDGHSVLRHALRGVFAAPAAQVVIVAPAGREGDALTDAVEAAGDRRDLISVVTGGATRQASVAAGLAALWGDVEVVLVHDAARALTPPEVFERVIAAVDATGAGVVPVLPVIDTIKRVEHDSVIGVVDRAALAAAQTPQGAPRDILVAAYAAASDDHTDDAALLAAAGCAVSTVPGDPLSFKITTPADLDRARGAMAQHPLAPVATTPFTRGSLAGGPTSGVGGHLRVGLGTDVHAFGGAGTLWLAGLEWPGEQALSGHSDGDAVAHAIVDALLSAAGLGDIGTHFGTDRPEFAGAHADVFLAHTRALLGAAGWSIVNVSVQVQTNQPKFTPRRIEAERVLSAALGGVSVSISATTTDALGFTGRDEGVAAFAVALLGGSSVASGG